MTVFSVRHPRSSWRGSILKIEGHGFPITNIGNDGKEGPDGFPITNVGHDGKETKKWIPDNQCRE